MSDLDITATLPEFPIIDGIEFRNVPGFLGYCVSSAGFVYTCKNARWGFRRTWRMLKWSRRPSGHLQVVLYAGKKTYSIDVHRVVIEVFKGDPPVGMECCHANGDATDNRIENLRWDTRKSNIEDARHHGTLICGSKSPAAILDDKTVLSIRDDHANGRGGYKVLGKKYGRPWQTIMNVARRKSWKHI